MRDARPTDRPLLTARDVVFISSIDWEWKWQGPQQIATRLARAGNRVLYVENTGVRAPKPSDARRVLRRITNTIRGLRSSVREIETGLFVVAPIVLPPFGSRLRRQTNRMLLRTSVGRAAKHLGLSDPIIISSLPTDTARETVELLRGSHSLLIYYSISDLVVMADALEEMMDSERLFLAEADVLLTHYSGLIERYGVEKRRVTEFAFGVDLDHFSLDGPISHVNDQRPVIGYVGGISQHLDAALVAKMARARPDWTWLLIGPQQGPASELQDLDNVHLLGHVAHDELPAWIRGFDVGIVPYKITPYTQTALPTKINEYLAVGKPVVSTRLPSLEGSEEPGVLHLATNDAESFLTCIEKALDATEHNELKGRRREIAARHDWDKKIELLSDLIVKSET